MQAWVTRSRSKPRSPKISLSNQAFVPDRPTPPSAPRQAPRSIHRIGQANHIIPITNPDIQNSISWSWKVTVPRRCDSSSHIFLRYDFEAREYVDLWFHVNWPATNRRVAAVELEWRIRSGQWQADYVRVSPPKQVALGLETCKFAFRNQVSQGNFLEGDGHILRSLDAISDTHLINLLLQFPVFSQQNHGCSLHKAVSCHICPSFPPFDTMGWGFHDWPWEHSCLFRNWLCGVFGWDYEMGCWPELWGFYSEYYYKSE